MRRPKVEKNIPRIEEGIPLPPPRKGKSTKPRLYFPFREMEVGDSFLLTQFKTQGAKAAARCMLTTQAREAGIKIATRVVDKGMRVWRIRGTK